MAKRFAPAPGAWDDQRRRVQEYLRDNPDYYKPAKPQKRPKSKYDLEEPESETEALIRFALAEVFGEVDILYVPRLRLASRKVEEGDLQPLLEYILGLKGHRVKEAVNQVISWVKERAEASKGETGEVC